MEGIVKVTAYTSASLVSVEVVVKLDGTNGGTPIDAGQRALV